MPLPQVLKDALSDQGTDIEALITAAAAERLKRREAAERGTVPTLNLSGGEWKSFKDCMDTPSVGSMDHVDSFGKAVAAVAADDKVEFARQMAITMLRLRRSLVQFS